MRVAKKCFLLRFVFTCVAKAVYKTTSRASEVERVSDSAGEVEAGDVLRLIIRFYGWVFGSGARPRWSRGADKKARMGKL